MARHPTLACTLLPFTAAEAILGSQAYLDNGYLGNGTSYSGMASPQAGIQTTNCEYYAPNDAIGIEASEQTASSAATQANLHKEFFETASSSEQPISLFGYRGFFFSQGQAQSIAQSFDLRLWVKNHWLEVSTMSFEDANQAMDIMVHNL